MHPFTCLYFHNQAQGVIKANMAVRFVLLTFRATRRRDGVGDMKDSAGITRNI